MDCVSVFFWQLENSLQKAINVNEAQGIGQTSPDPLLSGGIWARDFLHSQAHSKNHNGYNVECWGHTLSSMCQQCYKVAVTMSHVNSKLSHSYWGGLVCVWYNMLNNALLSLSLWRYHSCSYIFDCSAVSSSYVVFLLLVIRGVPSLILEQTQVSAPLNSRPVDGYRKGGATPIYTWSPAQSGSLDMLHVGLEHVGSLHAIVHMLWVTSSIYGT